MRCVDEVRTVEVRAARTSADVSFGDPFLRRISRIIPHCFLQLQAASRYRKSGHNAKKRSWPIISPKLKKS